MNTCRCNRCGFAANLSCQEMAARHVCGRPGLGDMVAKATKYLGIEPCTPCEARRRALNGVVPRFGRR